MFRLLTFVSTLLALGSYGLLAQEENDGLVVEKVQKASGGDEVGILAGDVIYSWSRLDSTSRMCYTGNLQSPFDYWNADVNQVPLGTMKLKLRRGPDVMEKTMPTRDMGLQVRPAFSGSHLQQYIKGKQLLASNNFERGIETFQSLATCLINDEGSQNHLESGVWLLAEMGKTQAQANNWHQVRATFELALQTASKRNAQGVKAHVFETEGNLYEDHNKYTEARQCFKEALELRRQFLPGELLAISHTYSRLGQISYLPGDISQAFDFFQESMDIRGLRVQHTVYFAQVLIDMGRVALDAGNLQEAESYFQRAYDIAAKAAPDSLIFYEAMQSLGDLARNHGHNARARQYLYQAFEAGQRLVPNSHYQGQILKSLGDRALAANLPHQAESFYRQAGDIFAELNPNGLAYAEILTGFAKVGRLLNLPEQVRSLLLKALDIVEKVAPDKTRHAHLLHALGTERVDRGQLEDGLVYFHKAHQVIEALPLGFDGMHEMQSSICTKWHSYYRDYMSTLISLKRYGEAFDISEQYRARSMLLVMGRRNKGPTKERGELAVIRKAMKELRANMLNPLAYEELADCQNKIGPDLIALKEREKQLLAEKNPMSAPSRYLKHQRAAELLDQDSCLLSYLILEKQSFLFVLTPDGACRGYNLIGESLARDISNFRRSIISPNSSTAHERMIALAQSLGVQLLKPAANQLEQAKHLVILPDGPLHALPFAALKAPQGQSLYLIQTHSLTIADSATTFHLNMQEVPSKTHPKLLKWVGFAPPCQEENIEHYKQLLNDFEVGLGLASTRSLRLEPLPFSGVEVDEIAGYFAQTSQVVMGKQVTEQEVRSQLGQAEILHFASHGLFNKEDPASSALVLQRDPNATGKENDGFLTAREIAALDFDASLVVLSACESGLGREQAREGAMSLARAFRFAGAHSVLASLWRVSDFSTTILMRRFYEHLLQVHSAAAALSLAQRDMLNTHGKVTSIAHPYYWAAFQLHGSSQINNW